MTNRAPDSAPDLIGQLRQWLEAARLQAAREDELNLTCLDEAALSTLAADLEGIAESAESLTLRIRECLEAKPSGDILQSQLIAIELTLKHAIWHWDSLVATLRRRDLWPDDDGSH